MPRKAPEETTWEEQGTTYEPADAGSAVVSVRFARADLRAVREAAARAGVSTSEFVREAAMARTRGTILTTDFGLSVGGTGVSLWPARSGTESTGPAVHTADPKARAG